MCSSAKAYRLLGKLQSQDPILDIASLKREKVQRYTFQISRSSFNNLAAVQLYHSRQDIFHHGARIHLHKLWGNWTAYDVAVPAY